MRSRQTSSGSPIETHTSVSSTSHPATASETSSVTVIRAPACTANSSAMRTTSSLGHSVRGLAGPGREFVGGRLGEASILDRVVHPPQHARRVLDGLLVAHMRAGWSEEGDVGALVICGYLESTAGPGGVLLEDQGDVLAL